MKCIKKLLFLLLLLCFSKINAISIQLYEKNMFELFSSCDTFSDLTVSFKIQGVINSSVSDGKAKYFFFEKVHENFTSSYLACLLSLPSDCKFETNNVCSCKSNASMNIYEINMKAPYAGNDDYKFVRAAVINDKGEQIYSNAIELPKDFQSDKVVDSIELEVNNLQVNKDECKLKSNEGNILLRVNYPWSKLLSINVINVTGNEKVVNQTENEIHIEKKFFNKSLLSITLEIVICQWSLMNVTCTFTTDYNQVEDNSKQIKLDFVVSILMIVVFLLLSLSFYRYKESGLKVTCQEKSNNYTENLNENATLLVTAKAEKMDEVKENNDQACTSSKKRKTYRLLLTGRLGNGKSATGNSILGKKVFQNSSNVTYVRPCVKYGVNQVFDSEIRVVEGPSVDPMHLNNTKALMGIFEMFKRAIKLSGGLDAILLILRFGNKFLKEDIETIKFLQTILGNDFIKKYCIVVLTYGDNFDVDETGTNSFEKWILKQKGPFKNLVKECEKRIILFDNRTKEEILRNRQVRELLVLIDKLKLYRNKYTLVNYNLSQKSRENLLRESLNYERSKFFKHGYIPQTPVMETDV